jgi:hypothetical protein
LFEHICRNAFPNIGGIAHVAKISNANFRRIEPRSCQIAHLVEECNALAVNRFCFFWVGDIVYNLNLLRLTCQYKSFSKAFGGFPVKPFQTAAKWRLVLRHILNNELDELGNACLRGTSRFFICRDDDIHQYFNGSQLANRQEFLLH